MKFFIVFMLYKSTSYCVMSVSIYRILPTPADLMLEVWTSVDGDDPFRVSFGSTALTSIGIDAIAEAIPSQICGVWKHFVDQHRLLSRPVYFDNVAKTAKVGLRPITTYAENATPAEIVDMLGSIDGFYR